MSLAKRYIPTTNYRELTVHKSVLAIKITERNLVSALNWATHFGAEAEAKWDVDKNGDTSNHRLKIKTPKGWRVVKVGEYLVRHYNYGINGHQLTKKSPLYYFSVGKDEFLKDFELAPKGIFQ